VKYYNIKELSKILHLDVSQIKQDVRTGKLPVPHKLIYKTKVWTEEEVLRLLELRKNNKGINI
jgi:hypothetical protein